MDIKKTIGKRINTALAKRGMLQKALAHILGVTDNTISYFCNGTRGPQLEQLPKIANALETTTDYLLGVSSNLTTDTDLAAVCKYTGLSEDSINTLLFISELDPNLLKTLDIFISAPYFSSFLLKFSNYCRDYEEYRSAKAQYTQDTDRLEKLSGGDIGKEINLLDSGKVELAYKQIDINKLHDAYELSEYKLNREFMNVAKKVADIFQTELESK